jgi:HAD superfamily hydrolase (TIGR01490 family)
VDLPAPGRSAAFFDLDKTVIAKSSTLAFSRPFYQGGLINRRSVLRSAYAQFVYLVGGADHDQMERMREYLSALSAGWDVQTVKDIVAETLHYIVDPLVYDEAVRLVEEHHDAGRDVVIVSSSGAEVVEPIGEMLGADSVIATRMVIRDGRYTGEIGYYVYGETKAEAIRELAERRGYDLSRSYAYSDSVTDVPMLESVGHPYAVNADRAMRKAAAERGWPLLSFSKPVTLRQRSMEANRSTIAAVAVGAGAAAAAGAALSHRPTRPGLGQGVPLRAEKAYNWSQHNSTDDTSAGHHAVISLHPGQSPSGHPGCDDEKQMHARSFALTCQERRPFAGRRSHVRRPRVVTCASRAKW